MDALKLCYLLLLPVAACFQDAEVPVVKMIQNEPDFTPLCTNTTQDPITLIMCRIRTERSGGEGCQLHYRYDYGFTQDCDSRFKLTTKNQTVFLHLSSLTTSDSGNYTCQCSNANGTFIYHFNVTVRGKNDNEGTISYAGDTCIIVIVLFIITSVILAFIHQRRRKRPESRSRRLDGEPQDIEPYSTFFRRESGLYSLVKFK